MSAPDDFFEPIVSKEDVQAPDDSRTPLYERMMSERKLGNEAPDTGNPADMSEIARELAMMEGSLQSVERALGSVIARLRPVVRHDAERVYKHASAGERIQRHEEMKLTTQYSRRVAAFNDRLSDLEGALIMLAEEVQI